MINISINTTNKKIYSDIKEKWDAISKPLDAFGDFEEVICKIGSIQETILPDISKRAVVIMCSDNGIVSEGVSQCGSEVTLAVAKLLGEGKSSVCTLCRTCGADWIPVNIGMEEEIKLPGVIDKPIRRGTRNFLTMPAMTKEETVKAINVGIDVVEELNNKGYKIIASGEMGIGNTTTSTALLCAMCNLNPEEITGRGAGLSDEGLRKKIDVIKRALGKYSFQGNRREQAFNKLMTFGGYDIAGLVGVYIGGAKYGIPVIIDGLISSVAALVAEEIVPGTKEYMIPSHSGKEHGTELVLRRLGFNSLINGNMAFGEGTGAVMLIPLLDMILDFYKNAGSFEQGNIEAYTRFGN